MSVSDIIKNGIIGVAVSCNYYYFSLSFRKSGIHQVHLGNCLFTCTVHKTFAVSCTIYMFCIQNAVRSWFWLGYLLLL